MQELLQKLRDSSERPTLNQSRRSICVVYTRKLRLCTPKPILTILVRGTRQEVWPAITFEIMRHPLAANMCEQYSR